MEHAFGVVSKKSLPYLKSARFSPIYLLGFLSFHFIFKSVIHFELIFVKGAMPVCIFTFSVLPPSSDLSSN